MTRKLMMLAAAVAVAYGAWAETETVGGYTWTYRINGDTAKIFNNYSAAISPKPTGAVTIPSTLGGRPVTSIGSCAFYNCSGLTSVTIPDSVTSIGDYAFERCSGLTSVTIPNSVTSIGERAFYDCSGLTSVTIGNGVTNIGNHAFHDCSGLTSVTIPNSVTSIGSYAFCGCSGLRNVALPVSVKTLGDGVFQNCTGLESVSIPVSITAIPYNAFYGCTSLRTLDLPVTVKSIGSYAFYSCVSLSSVSIPFSVKSIGSNAFYGCSSLSNLELASGLESIGYNAFYGCNGLREVVIPASVTSVSSYAFGACGNIRRVTVPGRVLGDMSSVFGDSCKTITSLAITEGVKSIDSSSFYNCDGLTSISIPASVTRIGESVFRYSCPALSEITIAPGNANYKFSGGLLLTKDGKEIVAVPRGRTWVSIPDTVTEIWRETFNNCPSLNFTWRNGVKSIDGWVLDCNEDDLPKNLTLSGYRGIANGAFSCCEALTGITIGEGVKSISAYSFGECSNLTSISIPASVTHIDDSAFDGCYRISSISLASGNRNYKYNGGLLVSADDTELVALSRTVTSVKIPEGVSCVRSGFFAGCAKLTSVTFPSSVEEIGDEGSVFGGWEEVETDDDWTYKFHGCPALKTITVTAGNPYWRSVNGMLLGMDDGDLFLKAVSQSLTTVNVPEGVLWMSDCAFVGCSKLTAVTFPRSLYKYDGELYYDENDSDESSGSYKLTSINVAAGNEEYSSANGLLLSADGTEIYEVPRGLTSVTIPASVTDVGAYDFEYCTKLKSFSVENGNKEFSAVNGMLLTKDGKELVCVPSTLKSQRTIMIPAGVTRIGGYAFGGFSQLTSIVIPEGVAEIGDYAFSYCTALSSVKLPQSLTKIGGDAFRDCSLTSLVLPNGLESIGARAFEGCKLSSISIPDSVTRIHADAFGSRGKSSSGTCEPSDVNNKNDVFDADSIPGLLLVDGWVVGLDSSSRIQNEQDDPTEYLNQALQDARIRGIACRAFEDCSWLRCLTLPSCVKYVGGSLFDGCSRLEWVDLPEGVRGIGSRAFAYCYNLNGISIPASVRSVAGDAFQGCRFIDSDSIPGLQLVDGWIMRDVSVSSQLAEDDSFDGTYVISGKQSIRGIAEGAFAGYGHGDHVGCGYFNTDPGLMGVTSLLVDDGVTAIGSMAFALCDDLTNVYVAASVQYIGEKAFYDCRGLKSVQLPDTLKGKLPDSVFAKCPTELKVTYYEAPRPVHEVCFDPNFADGDWSYRDIEEGRAIGLLPEVQRNRHMFLGWFTQSEGGEQISDRTLMGERDVTYYAHWWYYGDVFDGIAQVSFDENGNIVVTLTNDVSGTVEIPDNVGAVTIDLNGHNMVGDGGHGVTALPGPAIRIVKGDGEGDATQLAIVDTSEGEKGQIAGGGESAGIEVAEDAATGVKLDVEEGVGVFNGDGSEQVIKTKRPGTGKVTVPKSWKTGQKVTWKATADKGSVFARWEGPLVDSLNLTKNERRNPSLAFVVPEGFAANMVTAVFIMADDDDFHTLGITQTEFAPNETLSDIYVTDDSWSYVTAAVKGLPAGLKYDAKTMKISGKATKPGVYKVTVSATNATVKKPVTAEFEIVVPNFTTPMFEAAGLVTDGKYVFWAGVTPEGGAAVIDGDGGHAGRVTLPDVAKAIIGEGWTLKIAGLLSGLKYDAKTGKITGVPTKAGTFTVTFTATKGKASQVATITLNVEALPVWATGTFTGAAGTAAIPVGGAAETAAIPVSGAAGTAYPPSRRPKSPWRCPSRGAVPVRGAAGTAAVPVGGAEFGSATMTVAANGKISGKITIGGTNWTFSAASFSRVESDPSSEVGSPKSFVVEAVAKAGKVTMPVVLEVAACDGGHAGRVTLPNGVAEGTFGEGDVKMWRNVWKDKSTATEAKETIAGFEGVYTVAVEDGGYLSLTVGKDGNVKASGKLADGTGVSVTSPLMYDEDMGWFVMLYAAPSAYKGGSFAAAVGFDGHAGRVTLPSGPAQWTSRNPQATGEYGEGFAREVDLIGAYYNKTKSLNDYYDALKFSADLPTLNGVEPQNVGEVEIAIDAKGKPVIDKSSGLTLSFAQATGIFKGGYTFVFDAKTKKKVSFEGIFVQGENPRMDGFYLWDEAGVYEDPKTGKMKTYKYKQSYPVNLFSY